MLKIGLIRIAWRYEFVTGMVEAMRQFPNVMMVAKFRTCELVTRNDNVKANQLYSKHHQRKERDCSFGSDK